MMRASSGQGVGGQTGAEQVRLEDFAAAVAAIQDSKNTVAPHAP